MTNVQHISSIDPFTEIRIMTLSPLRGANFWSRRPIIRMDVEIGAYEDISSAESHAFTDQLLSALPGLDTHHCSIGKPGGFVQRLRTGTYAAHITEHVAIELQSMIGHEVGYGRTRGTGNVGEYTIVFEYVHQAVGLRTAALALEIVQHAFAGTLRTVQPAIAELTALAATADIPPLRQHVLCGITGSAGREVTRDVLAQFGFGTYMPNSNGNENGGKAFRSDPPLSDSPTDNTLVIGLSPMYILQAGLPYSHSDIAVILDTTPTDIPERYRDPERTAQLLSVLADAVPPNGPVVCPADAHYIHDIVRDAGRHLIKFPVSADPEIRAQHAAEQVAKYFTRSNV